MQRKKLLDEYAIPIAESLDSKPYIFSYPTFDATVFYLPFYDQDNMPQDGKYGGDSFAIEKLHDEHLFFLFRNGVDHGKTGRNAIHQNTIVLEEILSKQVSEEDIAKKIQHVDLFDRLDILAYALNELLVLRYKRPWATVASTFIAGVDRKGALRYVNSGDSCIFIISGNSIKNELFATERKPQIGFASVNKLYKTDEHFYVPREVELKPQDKIFIASDRLIESINTQKKLYGIKRLGRFIKAHCADKPYELILQINKDVKKFLGTNILNDDYTILMLEKK